jgi:LmbE family N-acetylglucosaminyl deacetylase
VTATPTRAGVGSRGPAPMPSRALVIVAHPDDAESLAAGTVALLTRAGAEVAYCVATNGAKGSDDRSMTPERLAMIRQAEQRDAAHVLGVRTVDFLGLLDCEVANTRETRLALTAAIRRHRPDLLLVQDPERTYRPGVSHRDHRIVAETALDCVASLAGTHLAFPELLARGLEPHAVREVRLMVGEGPGLVQDISETIELKIAALACHVSQMPDRLALDRNVRQRAARLGRPLGYRYAEIFVPLTTAEDDPGCRYDAPASPVRSAR